MSAVPKMADTGAAALARRSRDFPTLPQGFGGQIGIEPFEGFPQSSLKDDIFIAVAFGEVTVARNVGSMGDVPAKTFEPVKGDLLDIGFGDGGHGDSSDTVVPFPSRRLSASTGSLAATSSTWTDCRSSMFPRSSKITRKC